MLDALQIPVSECIACDSKASVQRFAKSNIAGLSHYFTQMSGLIRGSGYCVVHGRTCAIDGGPRPDIAILGPLCQPFSSLRQKTGASSRTGSARQHPLYSVTFEDTPAYIERYKPLIIVIELVSAFGEAGPDGRCALDEFLVFFRKFYPSVRVINLDANTWLEVSGPRTVVRSLRTHMVGDPFMKHDPCARSSLCLRAQRRL